MRATLITDMCEFKKRIYSYNENRQPQAFSQRLLENYLKTELMGASRNHC